MGQMFHRRDSGIESKINDLSGPDNLWSLCSLVPHLFISF